MDPSSVALVSFSSILVVASSAYIISVNYGRICACFFKNAIKHVSPVITAEDPEALDPVALV